MIKGDTAIRCALYRIPTRLWPGMCLLGHVPSHRARTTDKRVYISKQDSPPALARSWGSQSTWTSPGNGKYVGMSLSSLHGSAKEATALRKRRSGKHARTRESVAPHDHLSAQTNSLCVYFNRQACVGGFIVFNHPLSLHRCMEDYSSLSIFQKYPKELKFQGMHKLKVKQQRLRQLCLAFQKVVFVMEMPLKLF